MTSGGYPNYSGGLVPPRFASTRAKNKGKQQKPKPKPKQQRKRK